METTESALSESSVQIDESGPPMAIAGVGVASLLVSVALAAAGKGVPLHILGYVTGAIVPILIIGLARRVDLDNQASPAYAANKWFGPALVVLAVGAILAAVLHIWPLATELAS